MTVNPFHPVPPEEKLAAFKRSQQEHLRQHDQEERSDRRWRLVAAIALLIVLGVLAYIGIRQGGMPALECEDITPGKNTLTTWGSCHVVEK